MLSSPEVTLGEDDDLTWLRLVSLKQDRVCRLLLDLC